MDLRQDVSALPQRASIVPNPLSLQLRQSTGGYGPTAFAQTMNPTSPQLHSRYTLRDPGEAQARRGQTPRSLETGTQQFLPAPGDRIRSTNSLPLKGFHTERRPG